MILVTVEFILCPTFRINKASPMEQALCIACSICYLVIKFNTLKFEIYEM